jgi:hypothetical protein
MLIPADNTAAAREDDLPRRKVKKGIIDALREFRAVSAREGGLVPYAGAATVLGVSKQRVHDLVNEGTLRAIEQFGKKWLSANELESFVKLQRQSGRPWREPSIKEQWRAAMEGAKEQMAPAKKVRNKG